MKKLFAILLAFVVGAFAFGQTFAATGGVNWDVGFDIDHRTSGFEVMVDNLRFDVAIGDAQTIEKAADSGAYGYIGINGLRVSTMDDSGEKTAYQAPKDEITSYDWGTRDLLLRWNQMTAKLVFNDFFNVVVWYNNWNVLSDKTIGYTIYSGDGYGIANAYAYKLYNGEYGSSDVSGSMANGWELEGPDATPTNKVFFKAAAFEYNKAASNAFVAANYSIPAIADLTGIIGSYMSYRDTDRFVYDSAGKVLDNGNNGYTGVFTVNLTAVPNLTAIASIAGDVGIADKDYSPPAFGGKIQYKLAFGDLSLKPGVYFDGQLADIDGYGGFAKSTDKDDYAVAGGLEVGFKRTVATVNVGYGIDGKYTDTTKTADATVNSLRGTAAVNFQTIDNLTVKAAVEYVNADTGKTGSSALDTLGYHGYISYGIPVAKARYTPFAEVSSTNIGHRAKYNLYAKAGASASGLMANTTFTLFWDSNDLLNNFNTYKDAMFGRIVFRSSIKF